MPYFQLLSFLRSLGDNENSLIFELVGLNSEKNLQIVNQYFRNFYISKKMKYCNEIHRTRF